MTPLICTPAHFRITVTCDVQLSLAEIWPDGDAPENPTAQDVASLVMYQCGGILAVVHDWDLDLTMQINGGGTIATVPS